MRPGSEIGLVNEITAVYVRAYQQALGIGLQMMQDWMRAAAPLAGTSIGDVAVYFPFGQGFSQDIDPATNWGWIGGMATSWPEIEEEIVRREASYGTQLDVVMDLLDDIAAKTPDVDSEKLAALTDLRDRIGAVKRKYGRPIDG